MNKKEKIVWIPVLIKKHADRNGGHHHVILEDLDDNHVSVGLSTKSKKGKNSNSPNYKLDRDPLGGTDDSYMRRQGMVDKKNRYYKPRSGVMSPKDYAKARQYGEKAKKKYLEKKKKSNDVPNA